MTQTEEEYTPDMPDAWREDVVTPDIARERALVILEACEEIDQRNRADDWRGTRPPSTGGAAWGAAHVEAVRKENELTAELGVRQQRGPEHPPQQFPPGPWR